MFVYLEYTWQLPILFYSLWTRFPFQNSTELKLIDQKKHISYIVDSCFRFAILPLSINSYKNILKSITFALKSACIFHSFSFECNRVWWYMIWLRVKVSKMIPSPSFTYENVHECEQGITSFRTPKRNFHLSDKRTMFELCNFELYDLCRDIKTLSA